MSLSKKEFYGSFLSGMNNQLIKLKLTPIQEISDLKGKFENNLRKEEKNPVIDIPVTKEESLEKRKDDKNISNILNL